MSRYSKAIVALIPVLIALLNVLADYFGGGQVDGEDVSALLVTLAAALGVYVVPNKAPAGSVPDPTKSEVGPYHYEGGVADGHGAVDR